MNRDEAIKQLDWYFNNDGITADGRTHSAYATLRTIAYSYDGCETESKDGREAGKNELPIRRIPARSH